LKKSNDEIILCLIYDGLYGINSINRFLQNNNPKFSYKMCVWTYKIGDPVLFNESERFTPILYNNLKGSIMQIEPEENGVYFAIEIDKSITEFDVGLEYLQTLNTGNSIIRFYVSNKQN